MEGSILSQLVGQPESDYYDFLRSNFGRADEYLTTLHLKPSPALKPGEVWAIIPSIEYDRSRFVGATRSIVSSPAALTALVMYNGVGLGTKTTEYRMLGEWAADMPRGTFIMVDPLVKKKDITQTLLDLGIVDEAFTIHYRVVVVHVTQVMAPITFINE